MAGRDVEGDKRDNKGEDEQMAARYGESGEMIREDGGSVTYVAKGVAGVIINDRVGEDE